MASLTPHLSDSYLPVKPSCDRVVERGMLVCDLRPWAQCEDHQQSPALGHAVLHQRHTVCGVRQNYFFLKRVYVVIWKNASFLIKGDISRSYSGSYL